MRCKFRLSGLCVAGLVTFFLVTTSHAQLFNSPVNCDAGGFGPQSVALGDLNGDGKLDVVVANLNSATISVLLGNGDGTLRSAKTFPAGSYPFFVVLADFNHDGKLDAAVANRSMDKYGHGTVTILLGDGEGGFLSPVSYGAYADPVALAVGKFGRNGKLNIAVADSASGSLLLGNGDGTFRDGGAIGTQDAEWFAVKDLNKDHFQDLLVADDIGGQILSLLGNGHTSFSQAWSGVPATPPIAFAVADFNRDGNVDFASADSAIDGMGSNVEVFLGKGDGTFGPPTEYAVDAEPVSIAAGKLNRDGKLDLVTANQFAGTLSILLGNGDGSFQPAISIPSGGITPTSVAIGDLNGDSHADLVVAQPNGDSVSVLISTGKKK